MVKNDVNTGLYLVAMVGIVAVIGLVVLVMNSGSSSISLGTDDLTGQAIAPVTEPCTESDGGNYPYTKGFHTGTYPWGFAVTGLGVPDRCRENNNQPTDSCTNCKHTEYYCVDDPNDPRYEHLFWEITAGVDCEDGEIVENCVPNDCNGIECGVIDDGCGGTVDCGDPCNDGPGPVSFCDENNQCQVMPCDDLCQDRYGTEGICDGNLGSPEGRAYCENNEMCVCTPPTCTIDDDCTGYNPNFRCENNMCLYPDCNTACVDIYGYNSGSCGAVNGTAVGTAYCGLTYEQCMCS